MNNPINNYLSGPRAIYRRVAPDWLRAKLSSEKRLMRGLFGPHLDLPLYHGSTKVYLIASTPRSGSTLLGSLLDNCGSYGRPREFLNPSTRKYLKQRFRVNTDREMFVELQKVRTSQTGWFGLKSHWHHLDGLEDDPLLFGSNGLERAIWIYRKDLVAQAISASMAVQTKQWTANMPKQKAAIYDYDEIILHSNRIQYSNNCWREYFDRADQPSPLIVSYEELSKNTKSEFERITNYLDPTVEVNVEVKARLQKQRSGLNEEWRQRFENDVMPEHEHYLRPVVW